MEAVEIIENLFREFPFEPTKGQAELAEKLARFMVDPEARSVFVLKGYAGTGKTSFISALVRMLPKSGKKSVLLAPTGRAAKVFSAFSGSPAFTIHKRIYFQRMRRDGGMFLALQDNLYKNALFIVDEASMIAGNQQEGEDLFNSRNLLDDLMDYVWQGYRCRLMLIGDTAQLPPVGMDLSPALDLEHLKSRYSLKIYYHELTEVMRQSLESGILSNATRLRKMQLEEDVSHKLFDLQNHNDIISITGNELEEVLNTAYTKGEPDKSVIICRSNKRANIYNQEVRRRILYQENEVTSGDLLMVVRNNYFWLDPKSTAGFIANGDMITITRINKMEELYGFHFADISMKMIDYPDEPGLDVKIILDTIMSESPSLTREDSKKLFQGVLEEYQDIPDKSERYRKIRIDPYYNALQVKFAYALTCHKTQGGQWENVFIDQGYLTEDMINLEYQRWLYTALTRATSKVYLVNFSEKFF